MKPTTKAKKRPAAPAAAVPLDTWLANARRLLSLEQSEEVEAVREELRALSDAENPGVLSGLQLAALSTALFGRTLLKLALPAPALQRPKPHQFTVGDLVQIRLKRSAGSSAKAGAKPPTGIVARVEERFISVALSADDAGDVEESELLAEGNGIVLDRLANQATFAKMSSALDQLAKFDYGEAQRVVEVVFSGKAPSWTTPLPAISPFTSGLNASQLEAIRFALASKDLALIHGPPGTGKTTTVVELILQAVAAFEMKVLVCAPSNIAVDNVLEKLASASSATDRRLRLTRIGHPARVLPQILPYCLDARIQAAEGTEIVDDIRKETTSMLAKLQKTRDQGARAALRRDLKANRKEVRVREQKVVAELLKHSDVVFATNVGAASKLLRDLSFDLAVIDEAAQALEASCWIPILKAKRCVLAGDHLQLPPTIKSKAAASQGLDVTLFDRVAQMAHTRDVVKMLNVQYRMHQDISDWCSRAMYKGELGSFEGVATRKLHQLEHVSIDKDDELLNATLLLIDTAGCGLEEDSSNDDAGSTASPMLKLSKSNEGEARVVAKHVRDLLSAGLRQDEVAIITPYNKQVQALKALLLDEFPKLEIRSVDGFQGCEKEAVVMSLVRSNAAREVGFLSDDRRMNVAITRAKRHVAVVCDSDTIRAHKFLAELVKHFEDVGEYRSAQEFLDDDVVHGEGDAAAVAGAIAQARRVDAVARPERGGGRGDAGEAKRSEGRPSTSSTSAIGSEGKPHETKAPVKSGREAKQSKAKATTRGQDVTVSPLAAAGTIDKHEDGDSTADRGGIGTEEEEEEEEDLLVETKPSVFLAMQSSSDSESESDHEAEDASTTAADASGETQAANQLLKELHLSRMARQPPPPPPPQSASSSSKKKKKNQKKKAKKTGVAPPSATATPALAQTSVAPVSALQDGEDELEFLKREASSSSACSFQRAGGGPRCKKSVTMLGSICRFCNLKFCYDHAQPEVHGCGDAVRAFERAKFQAQMAGPPKDKGAKLTAEKRRLLQKKLEQKVGEQSASRATKAKPKKKK